MEITFTTEKNSSKLDVYRSYPSAFQRLCELVEKEHPSFQYIRKSVYSKDENKEVESYYVNDCLYKNEKKIFGFGGFSLDVENDSYSIKSN